MIQKQILLIYKELYYKNKKDIRYLRDAIQIALEEHRNDPEYYAWIIDEINSEFKHKSDTQENYEQIGALVAYLVYNKASVKSAIKTIAKWLGIAETTVRDGYYKIIHTYEVDPKNATYGELLRFFHQHEETPLKFVEKQSDKKKPFPSSNSKRNSKHSSVQEAMDSACNLVRYHQGKREKREEDAALERRSEHQDHYQYDDEY